MIKFKHKKVFIVVKRVIVFLAVETEHLALMAVFMRSFSECLWVKLGALVVFIPLVYLCTKNANVLTRVPSGSLVVEAFSSALFLFCGHAKFGHI